ncbi:MAG TPA: HAD family hydrolase [Verrucomicrobiae bacterium]
MRAAVFLDRDGTLIVEKNYLHRPEEVELFPGAGAALQRLCAAGYRLIMVTNQSGIGRGYYTLADAIRVNEHVCDLLAKEGAVIDKCYIAPEAPDQPSRGRKPSPAFLQDARDEFGLDLARSYMVGDKLIDLECGWNAGVKKSILVRTGYGSKTERQDAAQLGNGLVVNGLPEMTAWILADQPA